MQIHEDYLRSIVFGFQDGLVSTTGVVAGISAGVENPAIIVLAAFVAVSVEASSMAAGQYTSEKAVHEMDKEGKHKDNLILGAILMFFSYLFAGLIPITPILLFDKPVSNFLSIGAALAALFMLGFIKGKVVKNNALRSATELFLIGGTATAIGLAVGVFLKV
jgi:vacuolar iron transporter family protein